jgi:hypothetical protein
VSSDARTWQQTDLTAATFAKASISTGVAFSGGFVLAGTTVSGTNGCAGSDDSVKYTGALWHSSDGKTWARDTLPGAPIGDRVTMDVVRITDHALYATGTFETDNGTGTTEVDAAWTSTDGETWSKVNSRPPILGTKVYSNGQYGVVATLPYGLDDGRVSVWAFSAALQPVQLIQRGDGPPQSPGAMGPTGFLAASSDGTSFWLGVPMTH